MVEKDIIEIIFSLRSDAWQIWGFTSVINVTAIGWLISVKGLKETAQKILASILYSSFYLTMVASFYKVYIELEKAVLDLNKFEIQDSLNHKSGFVYYLHNIDYFNNFWYAFISNSFLALVFFIFIWNSKLMSKL